MANKKKQSRSDNYWMKFGGEIRQMNLGGTSSVGFDMMTGPTQLRTNKRLLPKAELGYSGIRSTNTQEIYPDAVSQQNQNTGQSLGNLGDTNLLQYLGPWGTAADMILDGIGFAGDVKQHKENMKDAYTAQGTLDKLNRDGANKDSLDMSTRTNAVGALASYQGTAAPDFKTELLPELAQGAGSMFKQVGGDQLKSLGMDKLKSLGRNLGGNGNVGTEDLPEMPSGMSMYGGTPKKRMYENGGLYANMNAKKKAGTSNSKANSTISDEAYRKMQNGFKMYGGDGGHVDFESGMDLKTLSRAAFGGGALNLQPGAGSGLAPLGDPYGAQAMMESVGTDQRSTGGPTNQAYEAEGGEAIMHETDGAPATSGNLDEVTQNLSMLEGASHSNGGEEVSGEGDQYVFSKKLKSDLWKKSFADAAETIGKNIEKYEKLSAEDDSDEITVSTANAMIQSWQQKLMDLQQEQETARQEKFMSMMESGAPSEELQQSFPDLFEQFMAEQQLEEQAQMQQGQGGMEQEAQMAANPMGNIDMSALSGEAQELVGAKYGLPQKEYGDDEAFEPFNFNQFMSDSGISIGDKSAAFSLDKNYMGDKNQLMDELTLNYPDGGYKVGDDTINTPKGMFDRLSSDFSDWRNTKLSDNYNTSTSKVNKADFTKDGVVDVEGYNNAMATQKYYNSGIPMDWESNYGSNAGQNDRQYFNNLKKQLQADGKSEAEVSSILNREKLKRSNDLDLLKSKSEQSVELTDAEKAEQQIAKLARQKSGGEILQRLGNNTGNLSPSLYNFGMGNKEISKAQFIGNKNEQNILDNLARMGNTDISQELDRNEQTLNMSKYMLRNASDGSSGGYMNALARMQNFKTDADRTTYMNKLKADTASLNTANEALYKMGENERTERLAMADDDLKSEAAKQAFTAKGWEGLSGYGQLQQKMANSASRDEQLRGLLDDIYPDVEMYMNRNGEMDIEKILGENPELVEYFKKTYKF